MIIVDESDAFVRLSLGSLTIALTLAVWDRPHGILVPIIMGLLVAMIGLAIETLLPIDSPLWRGFLWFTITGLVLDLGHSRGVSVSTNALVMASLFNAVLQAWLPTNSSKSLNR